ncbi:protein of unknown function [Candidatus Nitrosotalea okcheonensis]|uniref:Uncharacterized protein n=1 Tax=Candidatus Nitrosotalea okcheonensis TaxID=1903276 RepID=A0A2H1FHX3_9ARCH|nr:protein of unknown function [Candidatus Nitrosotalea okcheonensis]
MRGIEPLSGDPQSPILATVLQGPHEENLLQSSINLNSTGQMPTFSVPVLLFVTIGSVGLSSDIQTINTVKNNYVGHHWQPNV